MAVTSAELERAENNTLWQCRNANGTLYFVEKTNGQYLTWGNLGISTIPVGSKKSISISNAVTNINKAASSKTIVPGPLPTPKNQPKTETVNDDTGKKSEEAVEEAAKKIYKPGKRLKNPLGYLSSYTYQISLYMVTPIAYASFVASGRRKLDIDGVYLIAQSGGINNDSDNKIKRAPGFNLDYYIDNLKILTTGYKDSGSPAISTEFTFNIIEPYGFSFVSNLRKAAEYINKQSGDSGPSNSTKQLFVLGIRFFGYDHLGNLMNGKTVINGEPLDPNSSDTYSLFERYYDVILKDLNFRIEGKSVVYNIAANTWAPSQAFSVVRGIVNKNFNTTATKVGEALQALMNDLNAQQRETYKNSDPLTQYAIEFKGEGSDLIKFASMVTPDDLLKFKWPGSPATNPAQSNLAVEVKSQPNNSARMLSFKQDTPILQSINQVISLSSYVKDSLEVLYNSSLEPENKEVPNAQNTPKSNVSRWFNCSAETKVVKWHKEANDWQLEITYIIQVYDTPMIDSALAVSGGNYYGPFKRYEYWYTGQNTEVLSYSQTFNNAYFTTVLAEIFSEDASSNTAETPTISGMKTPESSQGTLGGTAQAVNNYTTSLFDPSALVEADIGILGDPDFLASDSSYVDETLNTKFYGPDGYTANFNSGQLFVEIDFKEAVDYSIKEGDTSVTAQPGTLAINDSIVFWTSSNPTRPALAYNVINIESTFANGSFKQRIHANLLPLENDTSESDEGRPLAGSENPSVTSNNPGPVPGDSTSAMGNNNLKKDKELPRENNISPTVEGPIEEITIIANRREVADDDAASNT